MNIGHNIAQSNLHDSLVPVFYGYDTGQNEIIAFEKLRIPYSQNEIHFFIEQPIPGGYSGFVH
jgi:hypothetical protein